MEFLYDRHIDCIVCHQPYITKKVRSRYIKTVRHDTDFCSYYENEKVNPLLYYVSVCPNCGFSASEEFSSHFPAITLQTIQTKICSNWSKQDYCDSRSFQDAINTYKLGIYSAILKKEKHITIAGLYMRLGWIYRTSLHQDEEIRFMKLALREYVNSYMKDDFKETNMSEVRLLYLIGDLNRRLKEYKQAIRYFSKVIERKKDTVEKRIVEMARERWYEIREAQKNVHTK